MLFKKYPLLVFRDHAGGPTRRLYLRPVYPLLFVALMAAAGCSLAVLAGYREAYLAAETRLEAAQEILAQQRKEAFALTHQVRDLLDDFATIQDFNPKLRVMLSLEETEGMGGALVGNRTREALDRSLSPPFHRPMFRAAHRVMERTREGILSEESHQQTLIFEVAEQKERLTRIPILWPVRGRLVSDFGYRKSPFTGRRAFHKGLDIRTGSGTPIQAPANGLITRAERFTTYGLCVDIDHGDGISTRYAHLKKIAVERGQQVARGEVIGYVGSTGRSLAPHLHYEVSVAGKLTDPMNYILK